MSFETVNNNWNENGYLDKQHEETCIFYFKIFTFSNRIHAVISISFYV